MRQRPRCPLLTVLSACLLAPAAWAQAPAGAEFLVNSLTTATQTFPEVAADPSGAFIASWFDFSGPLTTAFARRFDPGGAPLGPEFRVNGLTTANAREPVVAVDHRGRFAIAWYYFQANGTGMGAHARVFARDGAPLGPEFRLSLGTFSGTPRVAVLPGAFAATWTGYGGDIYARRFDASGPLGPQQLVNTYTTGAQWEPSVAGAPDGGFVVVWADAMPGNAGIFGRLYDRDAAPRGAAFRISTSPPGGQSVPQVGSDAAGNFVVSWQEHIPSPRRILARRYDAAGVPRDAPFVVNTFAIPNVYLHSTAVDRTGSFVVAWEADALDGDDSGIFARRYAADGVPRGAVFQVNTYTTLYQVIPAVASDGAGNLTALWMSTQLGQGYDVFGQRYGGLVPEAVAVSDGGNGILEVSESFTLRPSWRNVSGAAQTFQGRASDLSSPSGLALALTPDAVYGTVANGAVGTCSACFIGSLSGTRPPGHVDVSAVETIVPEAQGQAIRWVLHVGDSFTDVPRASPYYPFVETLLHRGVTAGCTPAAYCHAAPTTREQMAAFVLVAREGAGYAPPPCATPVFGDVPASSPFCRWIEELARRGVVSGCGGGNYCPSAAVTREEMSVFVLRTLDSGLDPPACATPVFGDVPASSPFCRWIEELARRGVVAGCGGGNYCPTAPVTREQMGVFISRTFALVVYGL